MNFYEFSNCLPLWHAELNFRLFALLKVIRGARATFVNAFRKANSGRRASAIVCVAASVLFCDFGGDSSLQLVGGECLPNANCFDEC